MNITTSILQETAMFDKVYKTVKASILSLVTSHREATLVSPLGLGRHPDHIIAACACRSAESHMSRKVIYYEDLPYAATYSMSGIVDHIKHFSTALAPHLVDIESVYDAKIQNLSAYRSQLRQTQIEAVGRQARRLSGSGVCERLWTRD